MVKLLFLSQKDRRPFERHLIRHYLGLHWFSETRPHHNMIRARDSNSTLRVSSWVIYRLRHLVSCNALVYDSFKGAEGYRFCVMSNHLAWTMRLLCGPFVWLCLMFWDILFLSLSPYPIFFTFLVIQILRRWILLACSSF